MATFTALYDACVLYPAPLRDLLMHLGMTNLFRVRWSEKIHEEWMAALLRNRPELATRLPRTRNLMNKAIPDATVTGYEHLIDGLQLPDPKDRHVLAAAIFGGANVIVTYNLKDFPPDILTPRKLEAQHPDDFIATQFDLSPALVAAEMKNIRAAMRNPPQSVAQMLQTFSGLNLPQTVHRLRSFADVI